MRDTIRRLLPPEESPPHLMMTEELRVQTRDVATLDSNVARSGELFVR
jgi:hypothetical protein